MKLSAKAKKAYDQVKDEATKMGDIKKLAKEIKQDHELAMELWSTREFHPRMLAVLIMDKKLLTQDLINTLDKDLQSNSTSEQSRIMDWLMANQLLKSKPTLALVESWIDSESVLQRKTYWYYEARRRWTGQPSPENTPELLVQIESKIASEAPPVQWAMNFTAGWIGVFDEQFRERCINIGKSTGLYEGEKIAKGCTPAYLPEFIRIEVEKRVPQ